MTRLECSALHDLADASEIDGLECQVLSASEDALAMVDPRDDGGRKRMVVVGSQIDWQTGLFVGSAELGIVTQGEYHVPPPATRGPVDDAEELLRLLIALVVAPHERLGDEDEDVARGHGDAWCRCRCG